MGQQTVRDGYNLVTYPIGWGLDDRAVDVVTPIGKAQAIKPDRIQLISTEHLLQQGCIFTPLVAINPAEIEALTHIAENAHYSVSDDDWNEAMSILRALLARLEGQSGE